MRVHSRSGAARRRRAGASGLLDRMETGAGQRRDDRLAVALGGNDGLESANANLMGQVSLAWDDEKTSREALLDAMARAGFREVIQV